MFFIRLDLIINRDYFPKHYPTNLCNEEAVGFVGDTSRKCKVNHFATYIAQYR
jgi:hypothetical protein